MGGRKEETRQSPPHSAFRKKPPSGGGDASPGRKGTKGTDVEWCQISVKGKILLLRKRETKIQQTERAHRGKETPVWLLRSVSRRSGKEKGGILYPSRPGPGAAEGRDL